MSTTEQPSLQTPVIDEQHPWLGLLTFKEEHHRFFFGRDAEIAEIIDRIKNNTLTILFGQSGLGKSSMLGAGVVRKLGSSGFAPILMRLDHAPGALSLLAQTREGLRKAMPAAPFPARDGSLWEFVHRSFPAGSASETTPVLIFDQFEEIFTLAKQNPEREAEAERWQEEIADLLQDRPPRELEERLSNEPDLWREYDFGRCPLRIVISMREDYLSHLEGLKAKLPLVTRNRMGLQLLNGPQALDAVYGPGALGSQELVSKEVAAIIVRTVAKVPPGTPLEQIKAVPPLLSLLSEQLNEDRISQGKKVITANMVTDQSDDILQRFYEESFSGIKEANREVVRELVEERMITVGGHRHPVALEDAEAELREQGVVDAATVLAKLVERRLLTSEEHRGIQRLEVTHDVLAPLVVRGRKQRQHRQAEVKARKRLTKRFFIAVYAVIPMLLVAAVIFAGKAIRESAKANKAATKAQEQSQVALMQRERALNAEQEQRHLLVQASYSDQETAIRLRTVGDAQEAMAYSERAVLFADENRSALTQAVAAALFDDVEVQRHAWRFPGAVVAMSPSRDPNNLVVLSADRTLRHLNTITGEQLWSTTLKESPHLLATTASNDIVVVGMDNGHVSALDLKSREMLWTSTLIGRIRSMAISYDGKTLFVGSTHGEIVAFDLEHGRKMWSDSNESSVTSVASAEGAVAYASGEGFIYFLSIGGLPEHSGKIKLRFGVTKIAYTAEGDLVAGLEDGHSRQVKPQHAD